MELMPCAINRGARFDATFGKGSSVYCTYFYCVETWAVVVVDRQTDTGEEEEQRLVSKQFGGGSGSGRWVVSTLPFAVRRSTDAERASRAG